jgi:hypothetical protein
MSETYIFVTLVFGTLHFMLLQPFPKTYIKFLHLQLLFQIIMKWEIQLAVNLITHLI